MNPHSLRPPARRRRGREGAQTVLEAGDAGGGASAPSEVGDVKRGGFSRPPPPWMAPAALHDATMGWVLVSSGCCTILSPHRITELTHATSGPRACECTSLACSKGACVLISCLPSCNDEMHNPSSGDIGAQDSGKQCRLD